MEKKLEEKRKPLIFAFCCTGGRRGCRQQRPQGRLGGSGGGHAGQLAVREPQWGRAVGPPIAGQRWRHADGWRRGRRWVARCGGAEN